MPIVTPLNLNGRPLVLHKAIVAPLLGSKTVLTNEPWDFVDLWLVREKKAEARFYWQQAREFSNVASGLPLQSAPLLLYYSFMNATKALLASRGLMVNPYHGVHEWDPLKGTGKKGHAFSVGVSIKSNGVLPSLSAYYGEQESNKTHPLKAILYNIPNIHRTYCLTYSSQKEMFIPIKAPTFVVENGTSNVFLAVSLVQDYTKKVSNRLPASIGINVTEPSETSFLSTTCTTISSTHKPTQQDIERLAQFAKAHREDLYYINGAHTLWYLKANGKSPDRIQRQTTTLTLAAMHRLSEVCRYAPMQLAKYLEGQKNWLLSEFIRMSGPQFIDEIASEITGMQFLVPNVRAAN